MEKRRGKSWHEGQSCDNRQLHGRKPLRMSEETNPQYEGQRNVALTTSERDGLEGGLERSFQVRTLQGSQPHRRHGHSWGLHQVKGSHSEPFLREWSQN